MLRKYHHPQQYQLPSWVKIVLHYANLPKAILTHTVGKNHPLWSRLILGAIIMLIAEFICEGAFLIRTLGHMLHTTGEMPWMEILIGMAEKHVNPQE